MSNSTTTNHLTDETMQLVKEVLNDFRNGPAKEESSLSKCCK
jgi:hypothetical protein